MKNYQYEYPRPALTTDSVIFGYDGKELNVLLVERQNEPYQNQWSLPGGYVHETENTLACAQRILLEKTGLKKTYIEQLYTFSDTNRDPRGWTISVAYFALLNPSDFDLKKGRNTNDVRWWNWTEIPKLAFDHKQILDIGIKRLKAKLTYQPIGFELLNTYFSMRDLQLLYECILEHSLDKRNFRKKLLKTELLILKKNQKKKNKNDPDLFRFDKTRYKKLEKEGFLFEI